MDDIMNIPSEEAAIVDSLVRLDKVDKGKKEHCRLQRGFHVKRHFAKAAVEVAAVTAVTGLANQGGLPLYLGVLAGAGVALHRGFHIAAHALGVKDHKYSMSEEVSKSVTMKSYALRHVKRLCTFGLYR